MKKILMGAVGLAGLMATPALAAAPSATYNFDGSVASVCTIAGAAATVGFGALTDSAGTYSQGGVSKDASDTNAYCNQGLTTATISHTNMVNTNVAGAGYTSVLPMTASLTTPESGTLNDSSVASGTASSSGTTATIGSFSALKVTATLASGPYKLTSGAYNGSITVTLTPTS
jgi:hypothetical protein